jgi:protein-tyrosine phosphatase
VNTRDLGGIVTQTGHKVIQGRVLRSDALNALTGEDVATLGGLGLRTVIDFRSPQEVAVAGPDRLPPGAGSVPLPILAGNLDEFFAGGPGKLRELLGDGKGERFMLGINRQFVADPAHREQFGRALRLIADRGRQPVLFHCSTGKDRAGWMTAVLLTALGVSRDQVMTDYLATNEYIWPAYERKLRDGADPDLLPLLRPLLVQDPAYIDAAFDEVTVRYQSFGHFLDGGLGFTDADVAQLRRSLLG